MAATIVNSDPEDADVVFIGAAYDCTSSYGKGADLGPEAIRTCLDTQIELYDRVSGASPALDRRIAWVDVPELSGMSPEAMVEAVAAEYRSHAGLRLLVGGEHSVTNGALVAHAGEAEGITVVQIDAHADLRADDSDYNDEPWGRFAHCSVMRRAHDLGYRLVQVGIRAYSADERALFDDPRIAVFEWGRRIPPVAEIVAAIRTPQVYLTVDADGFDPACMPATGTPVPGGLDWYYALDLVAAILRERRLVGADLVEVAPRPGDRRTEYAAAQLLYSIIGLAGARR